MKLATFHLFIILSVITNVGFSQAYELKKVKATRITEEPKIDGNPSDIQWKAAQATTGFFMYSPGDGDFLPNEYYTEVKILYNDLGIYILSVMKDPNPKNIHRVFGFRDQITQADNFAVLINPFISSNNTYMFMVTASGAQIDSNQPLK